MASLSRRHRVGQRRREQPSAAHSATTSNPAFSQRDRNAGRTPRAFSHSQGLAQIPRHALIDLRKSAAAQLAFHAGCG